MKPKASEIEEFLRESNAIEGVYDEQSYEDAVWAWGFLNKQGKDGLNPYLVMQVHDILMKNPGAWDDPKLLPYYRGVFRDCPIYIGGKQGMQHTLIPQKIEDWCEDMNAPHLGGNMAFTKLFHVAYERIHPFADGNGRTGRMFMNWWRLRNNLPLLIIHEGEEQMEYYKWFK